MKALLPILLLAALVGCAQEPSAPSVPPASWLEQVEQQAIANGVTPTTVHAALDNFTPNPRVIELDRKQPEGTVTFATYRHNTVAASRIQRGTLMMHDNMASLSAAEQRSGVPPQVIVALWGVESSFGQNMGSFETVNSLASLAYEGRRAEFFRGELIAALHILDSEHMDSHQLKGSWAGAMGQCQFMPTTYLKYAIDGNGDGRRDIWGSTEDVVASIANYLAAEGWQRGQSWGQPVTLTAPVDATYIGLNQTLTLDQWNALGVRQADGSLLSSGTAQASLLQPDGAGTPAFLVYDNIRAIMRWNHSTYFALSIGLLSDQIAFKD